MAEDLFVQIGYGDVTEAYAKISLLERNLTADEARWVSGLDDHSLDLLLLARPQSEVKPIKVASLAAPS
jgi:hypothetical protein